MKRTPADEAFSNLVREYHNQTCEMCGKVGRMECSHVFSRRHRSIRWDLENANCLCNGCHRKWHESPLQAAKWFVETFGQGRYDLLIEKRNQIFKVPKTEEKHIAKHYRDELKKLSSAREDGGTYQPVSY